ncbi:hypothetical protein [Demequina soli]|uniref:hypothetical protein n=1 Tax=Demequina soli TaxID=1638987 RepID=UPI000781FC67|nr:hypothetical protein [Demequina soli]
MAGKRPGSVTFVAALTWLVVVADLAAGVAMIWLYYHPDQVGGSVDSANLLWYGITTLVMGAFTAAVAAGLAMGSQGARWIVILMMLARIAGGAYALSKVGGTFAWQAAGEIVIAVVVIALLLGAHARAWFRAVPA